MHYRGFSVPRGPTVNDDKSVQNKHSNPDINLPFATLENPSSHR